MNGKCFCLMFSFILAVNVLPNARGNPNYDVVQFSPFDGYIHPQLLENMVTAQLRAQYSNAYGMGVYGFQSPLGVVFGGLRKLIWNTVSRVYPLIGAATNTARKKLKDFIGSSNSLRRRLSRVASYGLRTFNSKSMEAEESDEEEDNDEDPEDDEEKKKKNPKKDVKQKPPKKEKNLDALFE